MAHSRNDYQSSLKPVVGFSVYSREEQQIFFIICTTSVNHSSCQSSTSSLAQKPQCSIRNSDGGPLWAWKLTLNKLTLSICCTSTLCELHPSTSSFQVNSVFRLKRIMNEVLPVPFGSLLWVFVADFLRPSGLFPVSEVHRSRPPRLLPGPRSTSWASGSTPSCGTPSIPRVVSFTVWFVTAAYMWPTGWSLSPRSLE